MSGILPCGEPTFARGEGEWGGGGAHLCTKCRLATAVERFFGVKDLYEIHRTHSIT